MKPLPYPRNALPVNKESMLERPAIYNKHDSGDKEK
jgi:hypothetical protein